MKIEIKVPNVGESIVEATIEEWFKQSGDLVQQNEVLFTLETDKANVEVQAEKSGVLEITKEAGSTVPIGSTVAFLDPEGKKSSPSTETDTPLSPSVRRIVAEKNLDPKTIPGTGKGGRITKQDAIGTGSIPTARSKEPTKPAPIPSINQAEKGDVERVKMSTIRKRIGQRLLEAQYNAAILTTFNEIDMSAVMELRKRYKEDFQKRYGVKLGFMSFFTKGCVEALRAFPDVNAFIDGEDILYHHYYNIGIAVGAPKGLIVPVVKNAQDMNLAEIESTIRGFATRAAENKLTIQEMSGGTFTISNGGTYGSLLSTPILNPPQSAILGMHKIQDRPIAVQGRVEIRPMMYLALSYDHRIIDGKGAVSFLVKLKEVLEDPTRLLLGV